jgi:hypothetical protein
MTDVDVPYSTPHGPVRRNAGVKGRFAHSGQIGNLRLNASRDAVVAFSKGRPQLWGLGSRWGRVGQAAAAIPAAAKVRLFYQDVCLEPDRLGTRRLSSGSSVLGQ